MLETRDLAYAVTDVAKGIPSDFKGCGDHFLRFVLQVVRQLIRIFADEVSREVDERKLYERVFLILVLWFDLPSHLKFLRFCLFEHGAGSSADKKQNKKRSSHWSGDENAVGHQSWFVAVFPPYLRRVSAVSFRSFAKASSNGVCPLAFGSFTFAP